MISKHENKDYSLNKRSTAFALETETTESLVDDESKERKKERAKLKY